ncbi:thiamine ABC transporter ATP-binding protein [Rhizobium sp. C4]|uniref:thiamine ABC transporter ATP-binding protein n=1 Tax=Rhizobium sp. C4 TaxID=1349800 RepID=UPI001E3DE921|nr:ATP-binding cassette domain-containing protein [Rhizobium sp. C4]MCD2174775.1 ATP-binding cassette domain-containing protein [Rhizobium sp. C4]
MMQAIEVSGVGLTLGDHRFGFDLVVPAGAFVAVTGPSGAGKSTLFNILAGFEAPDEGRVLIGGQDMASVPPGKRPVSLVFQDNNLFAHLDIFTNVALGVSPSLRLDTVGRAAVSSALSRVGLSGFEKRMPGTLSGGERQRAAFARALVRKRPIMLLDEPFAALDPELRHQMGDLLGALHRDEGFTVLMITHDRDEARRLADRFILVEAGHVAAQGAIADLPVPQGG